MGKKNTHSFSSIVSVNPYNDTYFGGIASFLQQIENVQYRKDQYTISYLNNRDFITSQIEITKNIPEEDLYDAITSKIYDEFALDQAVEYKIQYIETFNNIDSSNRHFHVFIVDPAKIEEIFQQSVNKIKYIDTIIPAPLLIKTLYSKEIIEDSGIDCFIYFQKTDAFITIYREKEFLYTKSIKYSFIEMHERFCELYGEKIPYEDFIDFISKADLKDTQSEYKTYIIKLYKEILAIINDILTYAKRAYELDKISKIYIGTQIETISKFDEIAEAELGIRSGDFKFDYGIESDTHIDQLHALMHSYLTVDESQRYKCNFTNFTRPPKFMQRESGKLALLLAASFILAFIYPVTYWTLTYAKSIQYDLLQEQYKDLHNKKITREATIKTKEADKTKALALLKEQQEQYTQKKQTLIKVHEVKVNYPMKSKILSILTKDLNRFDVNVKEISYEQQNDSKTLHLYLVASRDKKITKLVEYLTKTYEDKFHFSLEEILYETKNKQYFSELKVSIL